VTVTLNAAWEKIELLEAIEGRKIGRGNDDDLRKLNRAAIHEFAADVAPALAVLNVPVGIDAYTTTYAPLARAKVRVWGNGDRISLYMYGNQTRVRLTLGGVVLGTAAVTGASNAWAQRNDMALAGATKDADGMMTLLIEVQRTTGSPTGTPTVYHVIVGEDILQLADLPAAGNTQTNFLAMHDELYATADGSVDTFALQRLDDNAESVLFERARRCCHLYPLLGNLWQFHRLSSCQWRLDGPYVIQVPQHAEGGLTVTIALEVSTVGFDLEAFVLSEYEDFNQARKDRAATYASGSTHYITTKNVKARAGETCFVWVAFRSEVSGSSASMPDAYFWSSMTPQTVLCERDGVLEAQQASAGGSWGFCIVATEENVMGVKNPAVEAALDYSPATQLLDIACIQGIDNSSGGTTDPALMLTISPHPGTGVTRAPEFGGRIQYWTGDPSNVSYQSQLDIRTMAIGFLYAVYIQCGPVVAPARRNRGWAGTPPTAGLMASVAQRLNALVFNGTGQCLMRHSGNKNNTPQQTLGGGENVFYFGDYLFVQGSGLASASYEWDVPLAPPNVSGGLASLKLYGQFILMVALGDGAGFPDQNEVAFECRWSTGDWVVGAASVTRKPSAGVQQSPTEADSIAAMNSTAIVVGSSPESALANAYAQCFTWPSEGSFKQGVWALGPVFMDESQPSFPVILTAEIKALGGSVYASVTRVIVAGLHVWWGPRES